MNERVAGLFRALILLSLLLLVHSSALGQTDEKRLSFTIASAPWTMTLPAGDFVMMREQYKSEGEGAYYYIVEQKQNLNVSFFIEPVSKCKTSKTCRDMIWKAGNPNWENPQDVVQSEIGEVSIFEFMVPSFRGQPVQQQNMYAEFVVDNFWVDLHISKVLYKPSERELFARLIKAIRFEPKKKS